MLVKGLKRGKLFYTQPQNLFSPDQRKCVILSLFTQAVYFFLHNEFRKGCIRFNSVLLVTITFKIKYYVTATVSVFVKASLFTLHDWILTYSLLSFQTSEEIFNTASILLYFILVHCYLKGQSSTFRSSIISLTFELY